MIRYLLTLVLGSYPLLAHAEVADKVMSREMMLMSSGMLFLAFLLVIKLRSHWLFWPYVAFLLFDIMGVVDFVMFDDSIFGLAINELGDSYKYATYAYLVSLVLLLLLTFYFFARRRAPRS